MNKEKIYELIVNIFHENGKEVAADVDSNLDEFGFNSLTFVKFLVLLETNYGIEFKDNDLDIGKYKNIEDICNKIKSFEKVIG